MKKETDAPGKKARRPSAITIAAGTRALRNYNATSASLPRCGARARTTGEPCRQVAMKNGKCYYHGGKTPSGASWHKTQWPDANDPNAEKKLYDKLKAAKKAHQRRANRLSAMTSDERARHERWQKTHQPGGAAGRATTRRQQKAAKEIAALLREGGTAPHTPEVERIQAEIDELKAQLAPPVNIFD